MKTYYSQTTNGFYVDEIHGNIMPPDSVEISSEKHAELLEKQNEGFMIVSDSNGYPVLVIRPEEPVIDEFHQTYADLRRDAYPPMTDYIDAVVKGDKEQMQKYIDDCLAVKAKYPKP
jgi:hypothetical protein